MVGDFEVTLASFTLVKYAKVLAAILHSYKGRFGFVNVAYKRSMMDRRRLEKKRKQSLQQSIKGRD